MFIWFVTVQGMDVSTMFDSCKTAHKQCLLCALCTNAPSPLDHLHTWKDYLWIEKDYIYGLKKTIYSSKKTWGYFCRIASLFSITWCTSNQSMNKNIYECHIKNRTICTKLQPNLPKFALPWLTLKIVSFKWHWSDHLEMTMTLDGDFDLAYEQGLGWNERKSWRASKIPLGFCFGI